MEPVGASNGRRLGGVTLERLHVGGVRFAFRQEGEGEPVLWIPPLGATHAAFNHLRRAMPPCRAILYDPRGLGQSDQPPDGYTVEEAARDAWGLLDGLGVAQAVLAGVSWGGTVVQAMARQHPERVRGLLLISTWLAPDPHRDELIRVWGELYGRVPLELFYREVHLWTFAPAFYRASATAIRRFQQGLAMGQGQPEPETFRAMTQSALLFDGRGSLQGLAVPVRVLVGGDDRVTPPEEGARLAAEIPGAQLRVVPGRGHGLLWEAPDEALVALRELLDWLEVRGG